MRTEPRDPIERRPLFPCRRIGGFVVKGILNTASLIAMPLTLHLSGPLLQRRDLLLLADAELDVNVRKMSL